MVSIQARFEDVAMPIVETLGVGAITPHLLRLLQNRTYGSTLKNQRSEVDQRCAICKEIVDLWSDPTEDDRTERMQAMLQRVNREEKENGGGTSLSRRKL